MTIALAGQPASIHVPALRDDCGCRDAPCDPPSALERNRFFPRKLMEVRHWQAEQAYHRRSRELLARLATGSGVLCGLEVILTGVKTLVLTAGVAADGRGRVIVVPEDVEIDPTRITGPHARATTGNQPTTGPVTVSLCYRECGTDLVAIPSHDCEDEPRGVPGMIREGFCVTVTPGRTDRVGLPEGLCTALQDGRTNDTPEGQTEERRLLLDRLDPRSCACGEDAVPLAVVAFDDLGGVHLDTSVRTVIRSNRELLDLILCLAERLADCCQRTPTAAPPRIVGLWPWPDEDGASRKLFFETDRIEVSFNRDMADGGLTAPGDWLGAWLIGNRGASRLTLTRTGTLDHLGFPADGDAAAFDVTLPRPATATDVVVIMAKSVPGGPIVAQASDRLALDPDLAATGLSEPQRAQLWSIAPGTTDPALAGLRNDALNAGSGLLNPPLSALPTGNGLAGGDLHLVLRAPRQVETPPRLLRIWPDGGTVLGPNNPESSEDRKSFQERARISLTVSRSLTPLSVANPKEWLKAWHGTLDGDFVHAVEELLLEPGVETKLPDGDVRYDFGLLTPDVLATGAAVVVQLRSSLPGVSYPPLGAEDPKLLLDADFNGTSLNSVDLWGLWDASVRAAQPPSPIPAPNPIPSAATLFDGHSGELAHWGFTIHWEV